MERPFPAYQGDEAYVFVCYGHEDSGSVYPEMKRLHEAGVRIWYDEGISPGTRWSDELASALSKASLVLFFCTTQSVKSQHCQDEVNFALDEKRPLLVIQDGAIDLPPGLRLRLGAHQAILKHELTAEQFAAKLTAAISRYLALGSGVTLDGPVASRAANYDKSIAVLPFMDMSETKDQEHFADGMTEEIINRLARVPDLLVSARTSSFYFKAKQAKIPEIARELGVAHLLEGSIRRSGDHLRVTAQLIRAENGYHLWSKTYDRELRDVFKVQDDIANAVVQALQIKLMGGELAHERGGTENLEAYLLYLRAGSAAAQFTRSEIDATGEYLHEAIRLDPSYGNAWAALAGNVMLKVGNGSLGATEGYGRARQFAQRAAQLSPTSAAAHARLALICLNFDWDWAAAEAEAQRALAVDPTSPSALSAAASVYLALGRWDDAEQKLRLALVRDPLNTSVISGLGVAYYGAARFAEAHKIGRKLLDLAPGFLWAGVFLGKMLVVEDKPEAALAIVEQERDEALRQALRPLVLQANGRLAEADEALKALIAQWGDKGAYVVAMTYAHRGDSDLALEWLERAYDQKDPDLVWILGEHLFKTIARDPRYKAFLRKMNLPV